MRVEQIAGLRYLRIEPDRNKLARYGLTIDDVNQLTETIAVGHHVGDVLEGERRFAIVVKTAHAYVGDLSVLEGLPLKSLSGQIVPLGDVAELSFSTGPAQVSREAQSRRLTVEFNVRGRDLLSVVHDAQRAVASKAPLPTGYRIEWGGQFQHYEDAKDRLMVVVPLALGLDSVPAVAGASLAASGPADLSQRAVRRRRRRRGAVGSRDPVLGLYGRRLHRAVRRGRVERSRPGLLCRATRTRRSLGQRRNRPRRELRLRPVLMTALVASLGFLPMALSTAPGAEVQRPLATVVIGGLVTATILTLLVLPAVYSLVKRPRAASSTPLL